MENMINEDNFGLQRQPSQKTVGQYLFDCLKLEGITEIFGIAGDYNFTLLDTLECYKGIRFIEGRNELNAGYSADGYARIKGMSALITTFGVGELSACNAIAGANSEHVPIIHIVGAPPENDQKEHKLMHHTLMDGNFDVFRNMYEQITAYSAVLTPENAKIEIPAAIQIAKEKKKPVYLVVADDLVTKPIKNRVEPTQQRPTSNLKTLHAAVNHVHKLLDRAHRPVILVDVKTMRFGLQAAVQQLADTMNVPVATMLYGKGGFDETHPNYVGMYLGSFGDSEVQSKVENADCIIAIGMVLADTNTASFTAKLNQLITVNIQPDMVKIAEAEYPNVLATDMLLAIQNVGYKGQGLVEKMSFPYDQLNTNTDAPLIAANYYPRFQQMLKEEDIVVVETGTFYYGMAEVRLPSDVIYIGQGGWQSIGYATPSAFGAIMAVPERRVFLFTGDGALQLTAQEISTMLYYGCKPIIFVLNNDGYTIEKYLNVKTKNQKYNKIPQWSYTKLAEVFGGDALTVTVRNYGELDQAINQAEIESTEKLCIIEMIVKDPMDASRYMKKMRNYMEEQEMQRTQQ
ncbi:alpha-keto acid decarboxylase family protein [Bacillus cereus ATCC 10876]|uniref:alpha-keto acid decarboxylase family protein n=1 Tax=Bacillus TaxID=1386 RepID=UPI0005340A2C|nr:MULTISPECIES: thiamine pyrophosphate-binding protein [Bacillus]MDJ0281813.1 thiamine pyrophosphate-binding protein [Bacillus bombysepticus]MBO1131972.1 alpha-keto acid decarboxylase family protein [Bacillus cereus]MDJ0295912.1 thiamine pyrophosphate-binding protein [Bacillus bombysepticus]MDJ0301566.1 thiamine pyrophosphate-binding protein [Bacillus bombysepticus]MDR4128376.1 alpha-keto acid decarboxylase family protein [Bacillus cereus ATCC 10876]